MMKVLIIEDEGIAASRLTKLISRIEPSFIVLDYLDSVKASVQWFNNNEQPDLIFLDIQLSDGLSFEILEMVQINAPIIFTTAYDQYAVQAFKSNSIDYLLKPVSEEELGVAINKFKQRSLNNTFTIDMLRSLAGQSNQYKNRFVIKVGEHLKSISTEDTEIFYSQNKATYLLTKEGHKYIIDYTLDQVESMIDPSIFFRINRSSIIGIKSISDIISYSSSRLKIKLHHFAENELIVSRERVADFKSWLEG